MELPNTHAHTYEIHTHRHTHKKRKKERKKQKQKKRGRGMGFRGVEERGYWGGQDLILITLDRHECFSVFHHLQKDKERKQRHSLKLDKKRRESSKRNYYIICPRVLIKAIIIISCARSRGKIFSCVSKLFSSQLCQVSMQDFFVCLEIIFISAVPGLEARFFVCLEIVFISAVPGLEARWKSNHIFWHSSFRPMHPTWFILLIYKNKVSQHEHDTTRNTFCSLD